MWHQWSGGCDESTCFEDGSPNNSPEDEISRLEGNMENIEFSRRTLVIIDITILAALIDLLQTEIYIPAIRNSLYPCSNQVTRRNSMNTK
jgi:hypothetical protein